MKLWRPHNFHFHHIFFVMKAHLSCAWLRKFRNHNCCCGEPCTGTKFLIAGTSTITYWRTRQVLCHVHSYCFDWSPVSSTNVPTRWHGAKNMCAARLVGLSPRAPHCIFYTNLYQSSKRSHLFWNKFSLMTWRCNHAFGIYRNAHAISKDEINESRRKVSHYQKKSPQKTLQIIYIIDLGEETDRQTELRCRQFVWCNMFEWLPCPTPNERSCGLVDRPRSMRSMGISRSIVVTLFHV